MSGLWKSGISFDVFGTPVALPSLVRDVLLVGVTIVSLLITPKGVREKNTFSWAPMQEVAKLFIGIFITMIPVLAAISAGSVFMGANTYIGNAPNFMVKAIAEGSGVKMPSFFGYMAWSCAVLVPLLLLMTWIFFL